MPKIHPNTASSTPASTHQKLITKDAKPAGDVQVLTVWKKSLLFNCSGFTVYDAQGNLSFRVDNYGSGNKAEILLMDASGKPLLTIRRKKLSLADIWMVYDGETDVNPTFMVKKKNFMNSKSLAQVIGSNKNVMYDIQGSYIQRCCSVYDSQKRVVAEIKRKEAIGGGAISFGTDIFRLVVQPDLDPTVAMALVILLDQMFGSRWSSST